MAKVWVFQHVACETLGTISRALESSGIAARYIRSFEGESVPKAMDEATGLIVMGGPMGVYDQFDYPFLQDEARLIEIALKEKKPVLGVCLGSQLLAATLGARVTKGNKKEIGWRPVELTAAASSDPLWSDVESPFTAYHWHGDIFELPPGAVPLAASDLTQFQAFRYGANAYGFLFHMEVTEKIIREMVQTFAGELREERLDGPSIIDQARAHLPGLQQIGAKVFARWAEFASSRAS